MYVDFKEITRTISRIPWFNCLTDLTFVDFWGVLELLISPGTIIHILVLKNVEYRFAFRWLSNKFITNRHNQINLFIVMGQVKWIIFWSLFFCSICFEKLFHFMSLKRMENYQNMDFLEVVKGNSPYKTQHKAIKSCSRQLYQLVIDSLVLIFHCFTRHLSCVDVAKHFPRIINKNAYFACVL